MTAMELTILMPCLNEANSVAFCIKEALEFLASREIAGEVLVADNGSTDGSGELAIAAGARVVTVPEKGYGHAIRWGIRAAGGRYVIVGDCDGSYDFSQLDLMYDRLRQGYDLVVGNRFAGGIEPKAMPLSHRYLGIPLLSWLGRCRFKVNVQDFHCGLRGMARDAAMEAGLQCGGMEFATEMIGRFSDAGLEITQVPVYLRRDLRQGPGHLRTISDGLRHLLLIAFWKKTKKSADF